VERGARERPVYLRLLAGILLTYALVISIGGSLVGDPLRVLLLGSMLWLAIRLHRLRQYRWWIIAGTLVLTIVAVLGKVLGSSRVAAAVIGLCTFVLISALIVAIISAVLEIGEIDTSAVLGVLCVYLLLALFFAAIYQVLGAVSPTHFLNGTSQPPSASDLLYFSVITMTTVGYGDITPAAEVARAVAVLEALTGQLYLVSVVAAVVAGWRRPPPAAPTAGPEAGPEHGE
jgi:hypothetical protein